MDVHAIFYARMILGFVQYACSMYIFGGEGRGEPIVMVEDRWQALWPRIALFAEGSCLDEVIDLPKWLRSSTRHQSTIALENRAADIWRCFPFTKTIQVQWGSPMETLE